MGHRVPVVSYIRLRTVLGSFSVLSDPAPLARLQIVCDYSVVVDRQYRLLRNEGVCLRNHRRLIMPLNLQRWHLATTQPSVV